MDVSIDIGSAALEGELAVPEGAVGLVLFAHGSGSSRLSPRNRYVAEHLQHASLATLLFDLLTREEGERDALTREHRFDIPLLAERLCAAVDWAVRHEATRDLPVGLFGASTGAAAALVAAAQRAEHVGAVVSRGGRPDLASDALPAVRAPTLLIVGARDELVLDLNRTAAQRLLAPHRLKTVPNATHLFEEPGALETAAQLAADWFKTHLHPPA